MTQAEAEPTVTALFQKWAKSVGKALPIRAADAGMAGFLWIQSNHPEALKFRSSADKWQVVHIWLRRAGMVTQ